MSKMIGKITKKHSDPDKRVHGPSFQSDFARGLLDSGKLGDDIIVTVAGKS